MNGTNAIAYRGLLAADIETGIGEHIAECEICDGRRWCDVLNALVGARRVLHNAGAPWLREPQ